MKKSNNEIEIIYNIGVADGKCSWDDIFDSEEELLKTLTEINFDVPYLYLPRGYELLGSFQKYLNSHGYLTEKQMIQLKRLAVSLAYASIHPYKPLKKLIKHTEIDK